MVSDIRPNLFTPEDLPKISPLKDDHSSRWEGFLFQSALESEHFTLLEVKQTTLSRLELESPRLDIEDTSLPDPDLSTQTSLTSSQDIKDLDDRSSDSFAEDRDCWALANVQRPPTENRLVGWDQVQGEDDEGNAPLFLSEASSCVYDAILRQGLPATERQTIKYVRCDVFVDALCFLAIGRSSVLFSWNPNTFDFNQNSENYTLSGLSRSLMRHLVQWFIESGVRFRNLRALPSGSTSTTTALTGAVSSCLDAIEEYLATFKASTMTPLRLQRLWSPVQTLLHDLETIALATIKGETNADQVEGFVRCLEEACRRHQNFHGVFREVSKRVLNPYLQAFSMKIGLIGQVSGLSLVSGLSPGLISHHIIDLMEETSVNLAVLQENDIDYNLLRAQAISRVYKGLHVEYHCHKLIELQQSADDYERRAIQLLHFKSIPRPGFDLLMEDSSRDSYDRDEMGVDPYQLDLDVYKENPFHMTQTVQNELDPLKNETRLALKISSLPEVFSVNPHEALNMSITPWVLAQHRLTSYSILRILLLDHNLLLHFDLLHRVELLGDGTFASRLSRALFDPNQASGEGMRRTGAITGLRLHSRDTWPPTSSELRLVLMGILAESVTNSNLVRLQDCISFAIRELSDNELERCREVDSIFALDFLRIFYKPPNTAIELMLTSECLEKYDRIFKHLLLLLRMKAGVQDLLVRVTGRQQMPYPLGPDHKLRLDLFHFVSTVIDYSQNIAINVPWKRLQSLLETAKRHLVRKEYQFTMDVVKSVSQLRDLHEHMLDEVLSALMLKSKQAAAKRILDDIFTLVLQFASATVQKSPKVQTASSHFCLKFHKHAHEFVRQLRKIMGKEEDSEASLLSQLLLKLDMNNYYERLAGFQNE